MDVILGGGRTCRQAPAPIKEPAAWCLGCCCWCCSGGLGSGGSTLLGGDGRCGVGEQDGADAVHDCLADVNVGSQDGDGGTVGGDDAGLGPVELGLGAGSGLPVVGNESRGWE